MGILPHLAIVLQMKYFHPAVNHSGVDFIAFVGLLRKKKMGGAWSVVPTLTRKTLKRSEGNNVGLEVDPLKIQSTQAEASHMRLSITCTLQSLPNIQGSS